LGFGGGPPRQSFFAFRRAVNKVTVLPDNRTRTALGQRKTTSARRLDVGSGATRPGSGNLAASESPHGPRLFPWRCRAGSANRLAQIFAAENDGVRHRREHWFLFFARGALGGRHWTRYGFRSRFGNCRAAARKRCTESGRACFRVWSSSSPVFFARADSEVYPDRGLGHVIDNDGEKSAPDTIRIEAVSVDEYGGESGAPDFIKCDVEGAEVEVFRGAEKLLNEKRPLILCEMHGEENRQTLLKVFADFGYRCEPCGENHILAQHTK
jgi:hypothetical protein